MQGALCPAWGRARRYRSGTFEELANGRQRIYGLLRLFRLDDGSLEVALNGVHQVLDHQERY